VIRYSWSLEKDRINRKKHGFALKDGIAVLDDPYAVVLDDVEPWSGEERWITIGQGARGVLTVVSFERDWDHVRIISVRRANDVEERRYRHGHP
jgi:uncharacterized DUF497 family protein